VKKNIYIYKLIYFCLVITLFTLVLIIKNKEIRVYQIIRIIYLILGLLLIYLFIRKKKEETNINDNYLLSNIIGLYNSNKLFHDLKILNTKKYNFRIAIINLNNLNELCKYYDVKIRKNVIIFLINEIKKIDFNFDIYSISQNQLAIITKHSDLKDFRINLLVLLNNFNFPIKIDNYVIKLIIKIGIINEKILYYYNPIEIYRKLIISIDQGDSLESGLYIYNNDFASKKKLYNDIANSIYNAITNDELYLVYQPIIDIKKEEISNYEILVRWDRGDKEPIGPDTFIKIAEDIGVISLITMWVTEQALINYNIWKEQNCCIPPSINITSKELIDDQFILSFFSLFRKYNTDINGFGLEITERVLSKDNIKLNKVLFDLQKKGFIIEIDDFGTGYNSLMFLGEIPSNVIKIDKYFIDKIYDLNMKNIIKKIISAIHKIGCIVIAEGVENKEQFQILKEINCDKIQGYYFSKPLKSNDFLDYYKKFNFNKYI